MPTKLASAPLQVASGQGAPDSDVVIVDVENHNALLPGDALGQHSDALSGGVVRR